LDQLGTPRVVLSVGPNQRLYRSCVTGCGTEANWSTVDLPVLRDSFSAIAVDEQNRVWVAASGNRLELAYCASGCTSVANWSLTTVVPQGGTFLYVVDLQMGGGGQAVLLYSLFSTAYNLRHASCASGCESSSAWSTRAVFSTGGTPSGPTYRFLPDGQGARLFGIRDEGGTSYREYRACDTCAPGVPPVLFQLSPATMRSFDVNEYGQPRFLVGSVASGLDLVSCDLGCNLAQSWTTTEVVPSPSSTESYRVQLLPGDRPLMISGTDSGNVVLRGAPAPDAPPGW
jgi:hypothetical protein